MLANIEKLERLDRERSNALFEELEQWNEVLKHNLEAAPRSLGHFDHDDIHGVDHNNGGPGL